MEIYFPLFLQSDVNSHGLNYEIAMNSSSRHIAIVAPSGYASDREAYTRAVKHLIDLGHQVHDFSSANARYQRFAATDADRKSTRLNSSH